MASRSNFFERSIRNKIQQDTKWRAYNAAEYQFMAGNWMKRFFITHPSHGCIPKL
jgi:hypothetical protein